MCGRESQKTDFALFRQAASSTNHAWGDRVASPQELGGFRICPPSPPKGYFVHTGYLNLANAGLDPP